MRLINFLLVLIIFSNCKNNSKQTDYKAIEIDTIYDLNSIKIDDSNKSDCVINQNRVLLGNYKSKLEIDEINEKSIEFYLKNPHISKNALALYRTEISPSDNECTFAILDSSCTENAETRPFYLHLLMFVNTISDGALSEVMGIYDLRFLNKYPNEFFDYILEMKANEAFNQVIFHIAFELYATDSIEGFLKFQSELRKKISSKHRQTADKFLSAIKKQFEDNLKGQ